MPRAALQSPFALSRRALRVGAAALGAALLVLAAGCGPDDEAQPVRVVTVVAFQDIDHIAEPDSGEAYWWHAEGGLDRKLELPGGFAPLYANEDGSQLLLITGPGKSNAGTSVMALGLDPRFDLSEAYWIEAGIAGGRPERVTIGSAVWERWAVDGEISAQIDPRQLDERFYASEVGCSKPQFCDESFSYGTNLYRLDPELHRAALALTRGIELSDSAKLDSYRDAYPQAAAQGKPSVLAGDLFGGDTFSHGSLLSGQMRWWVEEATGGKGTYAVTANEEPAVATAISRLAEAGRADLSRYAALRAVSNFDQEHPGQTALESLAEASAGGAPNGEAVALRNAYLVAGALTKEILENWGRWRGGPPS
jgi:purine nucleoside permease